MGFDLKDLDKYAAKAMGKMAKGTRTMLLEMKEAIKDGIETISISLDSCEDAEYTHREETDWMEGDDAAGMPFWMMKHGQDCEGVYEDEASEENAEEKEEAAQTRKEFLKMHGVTNELWTRYLTDRMDALLSALGDMIEALQEHDADRFTSAEHFLRSGIENCDAKRTELDQELIKRFGPDALSLEGIDPLPPRIRNKSPYEPMYFLMKGLTQAAPGQETADWIKTNRGRITQTANSLPDAWRKDLFSRYPIFKKLSEKTQEEA